MHACTLSYYFTTISSNCFAVAPFIDARCRRNRITNKTDKIMKETITKTNTNMAKAKRKLDVAGGGATVVVVVDVRSAVA